MLARLLRTVQLGFKSLLLHKLRSGLAMLGILIGVMAVIWLVALGEGVSYQAQKQIEELGATNVIVKSVKPPLSSSRDTAGSFFVEYGLTRDDYERIVTTVPSIQRSVPMREITSEARSGTRLADIHLVGCTSAYYEINHLQMARGRFLDDRDLDRRDNVCVLASEAARQLFPFQEPLGKAIQTSVNGQSDVYVIVGVTESRLPSAAIGGSLEGRDYNSDVYVPLSTFRARIGDQVLTTRAGGREGEVVQLNQITVTIDTIDRVEETAGVIQVLLEKYHKSADFAIVVPLELLRQAENLRMMFNILLVLIAGISLLVGGIGIMNIMLATVTERTREIGVRRALGARRRDIIVHFLAETTVLSATGGILGVLCGYLCGPVTQRVLSVIEEFRPDIWSALPLPIQNLEPIIAPTLILVAFSISVGVGIVFGLYPARRAALMDPIEALRHE